jgi:rare lipoprotein A
MYAPSTPALAVPALPSTTIVVGEAAPPPALAKPVAATLRVRRAVLNVLDGHAASVTGSLSVLPRGAAAHPVGETRTASATPLDATTQAAGAARSVAAAQRVVLQARGRHGWRTIATARAGARGRFRLRYRTVRVGSELLRLRFAGALGERGSQRAVGRLNVYRLVEASWYGGGGSLACGGWLTSTTLGVANKTLPCGTLVTLHYDGHTVRVPVIDRGPYVAGREYDLTEATKRALGFEGVGEVWATR